MTTEVQADRLRTIVHSKWRPGGSADSPAREQVLAADELAMAGDHEGALTGYRTALAQDPGSEVAALGEVVALLATGATQPALSIMESRFAQQHGDPVTRFHLGLALWAHSLDVRAHTRGGAPMIISRSQAATCRALADRILGLGLADAPLTEAATALRAEAEAGESWVWSPGVRYAPVVLGLGVSLLLLALGSWAEAVGPMVLAGVLGAVTLFLHVLLNRRQRLELRGRRYARLLTHKGT
ncbi:tetratricopeptide repeat protein [Crossiella sp. CA198]|uniref:tetratricopeptide repeat protein n=1 Tax=Crossiella sp. CA198 TaxID=3455607 RepID=UPI003F8D2466